MEIVIRLAWCFAYGICWGFGLTFGFWASFHALGLISTLQAVHETIRELQQKQQKIDLRLSLVEHDLNKKDRVIE